MKDTIAEARDGIESAILMAMHCNARGPRQKPERLGKDKEQICMDALCPRKPEFPKDFIAFDARSSERLYTASMECIVVDPISAIGNGLEVGFICNDGTFKWSKIAPMPKPRGIIAITNQPHRWFVHHYRTFREGTKQDYVRTPLAITLSGDVCLVKILGDWRGYNSAREKKETEEHLAMMLSVYEDSMRVGCFRATVEENVKMTFPIGQEHYKRFLIMRDGYRQTPTGRKNPILHWVSEYFRSASDVPVETHLRGAEEFVVGPMRVTISPSTGYGSVLPPQHS